MIPKIIHYFWIGNNPLGVKELKCIESWKKFCPDYELKLWNESNYDFSKYNYSKNAFKEKKYSFATDVARLDVLYEYGGIYLDTDVEIIKPLDYLLDCEGFCGFETKSKVNTGQIIASEKGNSIIKYLLDDYLNINFYNDNGTINTTACPVIQTKALQQKGLKLNGKKQIIENFIIYPVDYFGPYNFETEKIEITDNTFSIHHYAASWYSEKDKSRHSRIVYLNTHFWLFGKIIANLYRLSYNLKDNGLKATIKKILKKVV